MPLRKDAILLGLIAVVGVLNAATLVLVWHAQEAPAPAPGRAKTAAAPAPVAGRESPTAAPDDVAGRLGEIDAKLARLNEEVRALGERVGSGGATSAGPAASGGASGPTASAASPSGAEPTKMERMLQATQEAKEFWSDLANLTQLRQGMEEAEFADAVLEQTAQFLQLDAERESRFREIMGRRVAEYKGIRDEQTKMYEDVRAAMNAASSQEERRKHYEAQTRMNERIAARNRQFEKDAQAELGAVLTDGDFRHKAFRARLQNWFATLAFGQRTGWGGD